MSAVFDVNENSAGIPTPAILNGSRWHCCDKPTPRTLSDICRCSTLVLLVHCHSLDRCTYASADDVNVVDLVRFLRPKHLVSPFVVSVVVSYTQVMKSISFPTNEVVRVAEEAAAADCGHLYRGEYRRADVTCCLHTVQGCVEAASGLMQFSAGGEVAVLTLDSHVMKSD